MSILKSLLKNSKGVLFHSPKGISEYAESGKRTVHQLCEQEIPVSWHQFSVDDLANDETDPIYQLAKKTLNKNLEFDTAIFCCTPDVWFNHIEKYKIKFLRKKKIGYTAWETNKFPDLWVKYCNLMDEIWVPSKFNKEVLERCGVEVAVKVVPYPFIERNLYEINAETISKLIAMSIWHGGEKEQFNYSSEYKIFYTIGEWSDKSNIECVVRSFCKAFTINDKVKLVIKTYREDFSKRNITYCANQVETLLKKFPDHPEILLITENISVQDTLLLHSIGDYYISFSRGEGFSIDIFDAFNYNKKVITTGYGGQCDYLDKNYDGYVNFTLVDVSYKEKEKIYSDDQKWADPSIDDCVFKLKDAVKITKSVNETPITLKNGWYFLEKKNGVIFRQSSPTSILTINDGSYDFVKLKVKYENGVSTKNFTVLIDSLIKRDFVLTKNVIQEILIPITGTKQIDFSIIGDQSDTVKQDNRLLGISLESVSLIKNNSVLTYTVDKVLTENELSELYVFSKQEKELQKMPDFNQTIQSLTCELKPFGSKITQVRVKNESEFNGITYIGQYGTSGYATAAKGNLIHFFTKGVPISWIPLYFDNSQLSDECFYNAMVKSLIKKPIDNFDTVILHCTPDLWPEMRSRHKDLMKDRKVIGYTVWETNKLPYLWVESINDYVDEVWCPSEHNRLVFKESGIKIPIKVFPHIFMPKELPLKESVLMNVLDGEIVNKENSYYTFYNISELNPRKGVEDLVKTFCKAFSSKDKVRLILKVHYKNYDDKNKKYCVSVLNDIISTYENPPKIHIILNNLTEREILGLHSIGDCYISLCKSEGFGLTIFEAFKYDKKVITTGYGGQIDFLGKNYEGLVKYKLENVVGMDGFAKHYSEDQKWAYPDLKHAEELMIKAAR